MQCIPFDGVNHAFGAPADWDEATQGPCGTLPVMVEGDLYTSVWAPSAEERAAMIRGDFAVMLTIYGGQPPISLQVVRVEAKAADETPAE